METARPVKSEDVQIFQEVSEDTRRVEEMKTAIILIFVSFYAFTDAASVSDGTTLSLLQIKQLCALQE